MYLLCVYVPESHLEHLKSAVFAAGAGNIGDYECCSWQVKGQGQFRPLEGAQPHLGECGSIEYVEEYRVEVVVKKMAIEAVVDALKAAHPYEEPAYHFFEVRSS